MDTYKWKVLLEGSWQDLVSREQLPSIVGLVRATKGAGHNLDVALRHPRPRGVRGSRDREM